MLHDLPDFFEGVNKYMVKGDAFNTDHMDFLKAVDEDPCQNL